MAVGTAAMIGGAALLGGIAGQQGNKSSQTYSSQVNVAPASQEELNATRGISNSFDQLQQFSNLGPGAADITAGYNSQQDLAKMLQQFAAGGYAPTQQDQQLALQMLAPQQLAAQRAGEQAQTQYARNAALTGRGLNDFSFTNSLNKQLGNLQQDLAAQQSQLAAQQPGMRLGYQQNLTDLKSGLATQAMQNRAAIAGLGSQIQSAERNFRLGTAGKSGTQDTMSGGGTQGFIQGALGGAGAGFGLANMFSQQKPQAPQISPEAMAGRQAESSYQFPSQQAAPMPQFGVARGVSSYQGQPQQQFSPGPAASQGVPPYLSPTGPGYYPSLQQSLNPFPKMGGW